MTKALWTECKGQQHIKNLTHDVWRMVEAQHTSATRKLVDSIEEHDILEEMINSAKPNIDIKHTGFDYLHYTPFRYPPLAYGSRFGNRQERSLWYGSLKLSTAMAETAFYRFAFLRASEADFDIAETWLTAFETKIKTQKGIDLTKTPFAKHKKLISSPTNYQSSQALGNAMRNNNIEAFLYHSARDPQQHTNIAIIDPKAFAERHPKLGSFQSWQCFTTKDSVEFIRASSQQRELIKFTIENFMIENELPFPAN